ncbi:MAG: tRNA pseudouridine(38-40) synthase TruA [Actinomycetota bacterium]
MCNYRMLVSYDGAPFRGFARQPGLQTVQGGIEGALKRILGEEIRTSGAGRTDAGVHALGQVMSFRTGAAVPDPVGFQQSMNALCRPAIAVLELGEAPEGFDARHSALSRTYEYAILTREVHDPFSRHTTWHRPGRLEAEAMRKGADALVGEHDFSSFGRVEPGQSAVRRVESVEVEAAGDLVVIRITANSFLQQMVRSIVGTLARVGEGRRHPDQMGAVLDARDRSAAGPVAPPQGLFLVAVSYPEELFGVR